MGSAGLSGALAPESERPCSAPSRRPRRSDRPSDCASPARDAQPCAVHHHEHRGQTAVLLATSQPLAPSKFITQVELPWMPSCARSSRKRRRCRSERAVSSREFRARNSEMPFTPAARLRSAPARDGRCCRRGRARRGNEYLLSRNRVGASSCLTARVLMSRDRCRNGLRQIHRAGPFARRHFRQKADFSFRA